MSKIKIAIKNRWTGSIIFEYESEGNTLKTTLLKAVESGSDLRGSDLRGSNLSGSNLRDSDLSDSNLSGSNLRDSDLSGSNLSGSNLRDSDLSGSNLRDSDLSGSNLSGSNLRDSDLSGSNLSGSNLSGSNLRDSDLSSIKADFFLILLYARNEVRGLKDSLIKGNIDGSTYEGSCACLVGTIANVKKCSYNSITGITPDSSRPAERWFTGISKGDTPDTNNIAKITLEWIEEFETLTSNL